jgi:molybdenum cofactor cytidylyltransferase
MISAIVLAAGESARMGTPKALLPLGRGTFLSIICGRLAAAGADDVVVVLGAHAEAVRDAGVIPSVRIVVNEAYRDGQLSSLQCGVRAVPAAALGALVTLVDHPLIEVSTYRGLRDAGGKAPDLIFVAEYRGRGGHPVVFPRAVFDELLSAPRCGGARAVVRKDPSRVRRVTFDDPGIVADIDTPEEYKRFLTTEARRTRRKIR